MSPMAVINAWQLKNPPWRQYDYEKNRAGELLPDNAALTGITRRMVELRMSLIPYLYTAFFYYMKQGIPPFRALVTDYPDDSNTWELSDQILLGEDIMAAPVIMPDNGHRHIYLLEGEWYELNNGKRYGGSQWLEIAVPIDQIPIYIKSSSLIPWAEPKQFVDNEPFNLHLIKYGNAKATVQLIEDDGLSCDIMKCIYNVVEITADGNNYSISRSGTYKRADRYRISSYKTIM